MKIIIDTSSREKLILKLGDDIFLEQSSREKSQLLLPLLVEKLHERECEFSDISEIEVVTGPGSFTGLRVGVTVAQTLGWILHIPVNGHYMNKKKFIDIIY